MSPNSNRNRSVLICLALAIVTIAVFYQVHSYEYVNYDDPLYVSENLNIKTGITLQSVKWAFTSFYAGNWHPLTWLSHMLDWQLFGPAPAGHHITNLIFHIANTLLLFIVLKRMTKALWPSAFVAALFAFHPLHVESVAWISERKDVLSTFFWLLTMWAYVRFVGKPKTGNYLLVVLFFALGLMAKPMLVTLPFVLLLLDYWPLYRLCPKLGKELEEANAGHSISYLLFEKIPLFVIALASCVITFLVQRRAGATTQVEGLSLGIRFANASISYLQYIVKMIWPVRLAFFYPHPGENISMIHSVISTAFLLAVTILILRFAANRRYLATGWFWYLGTLLPVIGLVQVSDQAFADRYSYMTLTGLFIIIAWALPDLLGKWPHRKELLWTFSLIVLSVLAVCAHIQQRYWKNSTTLCQRATEVTKDNDKANFLLALALFEQGRFAEAIQPGTEVIRIRPDFVKALNLLGAAPWKTGKADEAIDYYEKAIEIDVHSASTHANLGLALAAKGKFDEAFEHYIIALETIDEPLIRRDFGDLLLKLGRFEEAVVEYRKALSAMPDNADVLNKIGYALAHMGQFDEAIEHFNQAVQIDPNHQDARRNLELVLTEKQKLQNKKTENAKQ